MYNLFQLLSTILKQSTCLELPQVPSTSLPHSVERFRVRSVSVLSIGDKGDLSKVPDERCERVGLQHDVLRCERSVNTT